MNNEQSTAGDLSTYLLRYLVKFGGPAVCFFSELQLHLSLKMLALGVSEHFRSHCPVLRLAQDPVELGKLGKPSFTCSV